MYQTCTIKNSISTASFGKDILPKCFHRSHLGYHFHINSTSSYPLKIKTWKKAVISLQEFGQGWQEDSSLALSMTWGCWLSLGKGHRLTGFITFYRPLRKLVWHGHLGHSISNQLYHVFRINSSAVYCVRMMEKCGLLEMTTILSYTSDPGKVYLGKEPM